VPKANAIAVRTVAMPAKIAAACAVGSGNIVDVEPPGL